MKGETDILTIQSECNLEYGMQTTMTTAANDELLRNRNRLVARSLYRQLRSEGFTHQQIIELSTTLLDFVTEDLKERVEPAK